MELVKGIIIIRKPKLSLSKKSRELLKFTFKASSLKKILGLGITHWAFILFTVVCGVLYLLFCVYLTVDMVRLYCTVL